MNNDKDRKDGRRTSRRAVSGMLLGASAGVLAASETRAAQGRASAPVLSAGTVEDHLAIEELIYRYGMALDACDQAHLEECFAPNAPQRAGMKSAIDYHLTYEQTMHRMMNHVYTVSGNTATGITYAIASMVKRGDTGLTKFDVHFYYRDDLVKQDNRWYFAKRDLSLVFSSEATPVQPGAPLLGFKVEPGSFRVPPLLGSRRP